MQKKRILLMYITETSGHHSATLAVEKAIKSLSAHAEVLNINAFRYTNPISEKIVNRLYMGVIKRTPHLWDFLYDNPKVAKQIGSIKNSIHKMNSPKLKKLFEKFKPDVVACTQAFPCGMVADYKKTHGVTLPLVAILTDYVPHSYWIYDTVDYYISPSDEISLKLINKGVPAGKIKCFGIPFDQKFNEPVDRATVLEKLKFTASATTILVMGGGQGLGPVKTIVKSLEKVHQPSQEIIVTGINKKLYRSLKRKIKKYKKPIALFGYTDKINELMTAADLIITKPGGITTAEALSKKLPLVIVKPIPGQEANNTRYLTEKGAAIKIDHPKQVHKALNSLLDDHDKLTRLKESASYISKPQASLDIARLLLDA